MQADPDAHFARKLAQHLRDEAIAESRSEAIDAVKAEIVSSILSTGSFTWGGKPSQTIGDCEMLEEVDYFDLITAAQPKNHTVAGQLLSDALRSAAMRVADTYAPSVFDHRNARAISDAAEDRAVDRRFA